MKILTEQHRNIYTILKSNKKATNTKNYRPVVPTSCIEKHAKEETTRIGWNQLWDTKSCQCYNGYVSGEALETKRTLSTYTNACKQHSVTTKQY